MSKRWLPLFAILTVFALLAGACSNNNSSSTKNDNGSKGSGPTSNGLFPSSLVNKAVHTGTPKSGGSITYGVESDVLAVSPNQNLIQPADVQMAYAVFDPLVSYGDQGKFSGVPVTDNTDHHYNQLADKLTSTPDLKTWTLTLRSGVKFSNGVPLTAQEVVDQTTWVQNSPKCACAPDAANIASVTASGPLTVTYVLKTPVVDFPGKLVGGGLGWITESGARSKSADLDNPGIKDLVGTGPFEYLNKSGDSYTVVRNPSYYGKDPVTGAQLPYLDKITFQPLADTTTRLQAVQSNGVQIMQTADTSNLSQAKADPNLVVQPSEGSSSTILVLNLTHPPFGISGTGDAASIAKKSLDDPNALAARQAFNYSINRNEINQKYYKGARVPAYGFIPDSSYWFDPNGQLPRYNPTKAKSIITDLKNKGMSTKLNALCINTPESTGIFSILKQQAAAVGINPNLKQVDQAVLVTALLGGSTDIPWDVACFRSPQIADPDGIYNALYSTGSTNLVKYNRPNVDKLLTDGRTTTDKAKRKAIYDQIQEQVAKDVVYIPLLFDYWGNVFQKSISGLTTPSPASLGIIRPGNLYYVK